MADLTPHLILDWLREQWRAMAERLDDLICSFDAPVPEGMDPLTVLLLGWIVFFCVLAVVVNLVKRFRKSSAETKAVSRESVSNNVEKSSSATSSNGATVRQVESVNVSSKNTSDVEAVDPTFLSRVQSAVPFKEAVSHRGHSPSPQRQVKIPHVTGAPVASGADPDGVLWVNNVINWIYGRAEVRNDIAQAWLAALNSHAAKLSREAGINLHFVGIRPQNERPDFSNVVVEAGPNDNMTITADCLCQPRLTTRVTYEQEGQTRSATYDTDVDLLRGRVNVAALTHQAMAIGKFDGWPEVQIQMALTDDRGRSSSLEEQIRQEGATEVITGCLRGAVVDLSFASHPDFPRFIRRNELDKPRSLSRDPSECDGGGERVTRRLLVKIVKAAGLGAEKGCKEPYCVVEMDEPAQKYQTGSKLDTDHPSWEESFIFDLSPNTAELLFEVFDKQQSRETGFLGLGIVGIEELLITPSQRQVIPLLSRPYEHDTVSGSITVEFMFVDEEGRPVEEVGSSPHRVAQTSERILSSGEVLQTTRTTYVKPEDIDDGDYVKSLALRDLESKGKPNAKKSTLIIHSSKKESVPLPRVQVQRNNDGLWVEVTIKDNLDESIQLSEGGSELAETDRSATLPASASPVGDDLGRGRRRSKRSFFGSLRRRLGGSKSRSKSSDPTEPQGTAARSVSLDRSKYLTVPKTEGASGGDDVTSSPAAAGAGPVGGGLSRKPTQPVSTAGRMSGLDDSSLSDMSGISNASNRTYVNEDSTLVLETLENGILKHYLIPNNLAKKRNWRKKGTKLHIYNEHIFVAKHLPKDTTLHCVSAPESEQKKPSALCSVCEKPLPRWLGKQAYECRDCQIRVHKQCHVRVETVCPNATVHTMELEYVQTMEEKRQRNMTR